jgi:hypothetical protein
MDVNLILYLKKTYPHFSVDIKFLKALKKQLLINIFIKKYSDDNANSTTKCKIM